MIRGLIGVIHLPAMPGDPGYEGDGGFDGVFTHALRDAEALAEGGVDGVIVENFGSSPFPKGTRGDRVPPHQVVTIARVAAACAERFGLPVGVNCLRNDACAAIGVAAAAGLAFVRVNVHTGAYVTDQGLIEGEAADTLRYRSALEATGVSILADVLVKHAAPLAPLDPVTATKDCLLRGHADGVIVTGTATGAPIDRSVLEEVRGAAGGAPVFLGSGVTPAFADDLAPLAHGAIVGTWIKEGGDVRAPVCRERVRTLANALQGVFLTA
jgi:membrane complex biogenesis BtpA family protein